MSNRAEVAALRQTIHVALLTMPHSVELGLHAESALFRLCALAASAGETGKPKIPASAVLSDRPRDFAARGIDCHIVRADAVDVLPAARHSGAVPDSQEKPK